MKMYKKFEDYWQNYIERDLKYKFIKRIEEGSPKIEEFRDEWDIPAGGFETKKEVEEWDKKQRDKEENKHFLVYLTQTELRYCTNGFALADFFPSTREERRPRETKPITAFEAKFHIAVRRLIRELRLDPLWYHPIVKYLLMGKVDMRRVVNTGIGVSERVWQDNKGDEIERNICLTFGPNTRIEDIRQIWNPQVKKLQEKLPGYFREDLRITEAVAKKYKLGKYSEKHYPKAKKVKSVTTKDTCQQQMSGITTRN